MARTEEQPRGLRRELGLRGAVALGVGGTVGGGIYVLIGAAAAEAGPAALVAFGLAFLLALLIALPYAELACRYPHAGGGYAFARAAFGNRVGFLMGWGFWGAYLFISGYVTLGFGGYLAAATGLPVLAGALLLIAGCIALNLVGIRVSGRAQAAVVAIAVIGLIAFVCWGTPAVEISRFTPLFPVGAQGLFLAALLAFLAFGGFDMIAAAGEEVERPERNLPLAILVTLVAVAVLYLLVCAVALGVLGSKALGASEAPLADAARRFGGAEARQLILAAALLTTAATTNAILVVTSRISFAMARDGLLPAALGRVSARSGTPWSACLLSGILLGVVALAGSVKFVAAVGGFLYVLHFLVPLAALVALRRRGIGAPAFRTPAPRLVLPLAFAGCIGLLLASGTAGILVGTAWLALGFALDQARRRTRRRRAHRVERTSLKRSHRRRAVGVPLANSRS